MSEALAAFLGALAAFLGALIGTIVQGVLAWKAEAAAKRERANYLAIRVVNALDLFVDGCAAVSADDGHLEGPSDEAVATTATPAMPKFPEDLDWRSIDHLLAFDVLSLGTKIADAQGAVSAASSYASPPGFNEYFETRRRAYADLGFEAARLARALRDTHSLPPRTFVRWNAEEVLAEQKARLDAEDQERQSRESLV